MRFSVSKYFLIFIFASTFTVCFAQEKPEARLIDKFGLVPCDDFWARQDNFFVELQNSPDAIGYAVIYGSQSLPREKLAREERLRGIINFRNFDKNRLVIVRGKDSTEPRTEFWIVPAGADKPDFDEAKWDFTFPAKQKPFIYFSLETSDYICPSGDVLKTYSEYLAANPKARANIVIYARSKKEFEKQKKNFSDELTGKYNVSPKRVRFFFVKAKNDENYELWLLP